MKCIGCGEDFIPSFDKTSRCVKCRRIYQKQWRARQKEEGLPVVSVRMPREYFIEYELTYSALPEVRKRRAARMRGYTKDPALQHKHKARSIVGTAVASGRLKRGTCEVCGDEKVEAHHDDYAAPLEVRWLCKLHHMEHHAAKATGALP